MSWVTIIWPMVASACLTLAALHLMVWCKGTKARASLLFSLTAVGTAGAALCELWMMRARTVEEFGLALRWLHAPGWVVVISLVGFVRVHLRAGRPWLAWTVCGVRTLALILNFVFAPNLNYREVMVLRQSRFLGESISVAEGMPNPWMLVGQAGLVLLAAFVVDVMITVWRRGDRRQARLLSSAIVFFVVASTVQIVLGLWGIVNTPVTPSLFFLGIVAAMGLELSDGILGAAKLADDLVESEGRFRAIADTAPVMIWMSGTDKLCNFFNQGWLEFTGRSQEQELGEGWTRGVHPDDLAGCLKNYAQSFDARRPFTMEYRLRRHDGEYRWISDNGVPRYNSDRSFLGYIGSCVDLTERKRADDKFRLAVEASPNGIVLANDQGRIVLVNAETERLFGYTREELIDHTVEMLVPERFRGSHPGYRAGFFAAPEAGAMGAGRELYARRKDGTEFPVEIGLSPIQSAEGILVLTAIADITHRKQSEHEIEQQRNELAHLSRVTTVSELSGSLAHELNQPLAIILTNAQAAQRLLAQEPPDLAEARDILADIVSEDRRAGEVIRRLRSLLKHGETTLQPLPVNEIVEEVFRLARSDLIRRGVTVHRALAGGTPKVFGDRIQLQQVLLNLILNACDAMAANSSAGRRLTLATGQHEGAVRFSVSDNGCGLPPDVERIFEPFYTTKSHGLGLGLSICRSIITAHKGRLWAEAPIGAWASPDGNATGGKLSPCRAGAASAAANEGHGATFHVELPAATETTG